MNTSNKQAESISEIKRQRTVNRNIAMTMGLLFVALLIGSTTTTAPGESLSAGDWAWGGLSVTAFAILLGVLYTAYKQADERQKLVQLKAAAITFMALIFSLVTAQLAYALDLVKMDMAVQIIVIGTILLWMTLQKAVERRSN